LGGPETVFPANTYVVLDIPSPFAERVLAIRESQQDFFRWSLPAETTVSGSSGTGPISQDEDPEHVRQVLDRIAAGTAPINASFDAVRRFQGSDVFYLPFVDERPLRELHERIARSGLRFSSMPFDFTPHCTVRTRSPIADEDATDLLATSVPGAFTLDILSLYQLSAAQSAPAGSFAVLLCLLHRAHLTGPA
jgi:2'-5' RNA ligase superfamily protein